MIDALLFWFTVLQRTLRRRFGLQIWARETGCPEQTSLPSPGLFDHDLE